MTQARQSQIDPDTTPYYHCINRCVRRAFLCGKDDVTGRSFDHRKQWIVDKLKSLGELFAIDICAYAVMSNHYHLVLHINQDKAAGWDDKTVVQHWRELFRGDVLIERWCQNESLNEMEQTAVEEKIATWRERLLDISWFMRCLNESIARLANKEDECQGHFWQGRFKSQALLDEAAVLSCMMYVDLNPIRAGSANNLQDSDFTSIQQRLQEFAERKAGRPKQVTASAVPELLSFTCTTSASQENTTLSDKTATTPTIPFNFADYCELIDWTGRAIHEDKRGYIPPHIQPLLQQLGIKPDHWLDTVKHFGSRFPMMAGKLERMQAAAAKFGQQWCQGISCARRSYA